MRVGEIRREEHLFRFVRLVERRVDGPLGERWLVVDLRTDRRFMCFGYELGLKTYSEMEILAQFSSE